MDYELFETHIKTKLELLDVLYEAEAGVRISTLAIKLGTGEKNVVKYMEDLQEDLAQFHIVEDGEAEIDFFKGKGYSFNGNELDYKKLALFILNQSMNFSLLRNLFLNHDVDARNILDNYYISESTLRRKIAAINHYVSSYGLSLKHNRGRLIMVGKEMTIRYFGYRFFWRFYTGVSWPFPAIDQRKILPLVKLALENYKLAQKNALIQEFSYFFALNVTRFHNKYPIPAEALPDYIREINHQLLFPRSSFYQEFQQSFHVTDDEVEFTGLLFQCRVQFYMQDNKLREALLIHQQFNTSIYELYTLFIQLTDIMYTPVETQLNLNFCHALILSAHLHSMFFESFITVASGYDLSFFYQKNYPHLFEYMRGILQKMKQQSSSPILENEAFLLPRYCEAFSAINIFTKFEPKIVVKIDTNLTMALEYILAQKLEQIFKNFYNIRFISFIEIDQSAEEHYDIILSSVIQDVEGSQYKGIPLYTFRPQLAVSDITKIHQILENYVTNYNKKKQ